MNRLKPEQGDLFDARMAVVRLSLYTIFIFVITILLPFIVQSGQVQAFREEGWIEWCQLLLLLITSGIYFWGAYEGTNPEELFFLLGCLVAFATVRELDSFFDRWVPWVGWKFGYLILINAIVRAARHRSTIYRQIWDFLGAPSVLILWRGFLFVVPVGQLIGHGPFLKSLMGNDYTHDYKRVLEEVFELLGYIIILAGTMEMAMELRKSRQPGKKGYERPQLFNLLKPQR